jgi:hypothetical protein
VFAAALNPGASPADTFRTTWFLATAIKNPSSAVTTTPAGVIGLVVGICQQARGD